MSSFMAAVDRVEQWRRVTEHYRSLTDDELIAIAQDKEDLTEVAQQALESEIASRKLRIPPEEPEESPDIVLDPQSDPDSPYEAERELVLIETVFSLRDAQQLQELLNEDGIPFYMGEERATRAEDVKSNFTKGVTVKIMRIGLPYATRARMNFHPQDDPEERDLQEAKVAPEPDPLFCPKCRSEEVVLERSRPDSSLPTGTRFAWRCEACGKRWEDDGVVTES